MTKEVYPASIWPLTSSLVTLISSGVPCLIPIWSVCSAHMSNPTFLAVSLVLRENSTGFSQVYPPFRSHSDLASSTISAASISLSSPEYTPADQGNPGIGCQYDTLFILQAVKNSAPDLAPTSASFMNLSPLLIPFRFP